MLKFLLYIFFLLLLLYTKIKYYFLLKNCQSLILIKTPQQFQKNFRLYFLILFDIQYKSSKYITYKVNRFLLYLKIYNEIYQKLLVFCNYFFLLNLFSKFATDFQTTIFFINKKRDCRFDKSLVFEIFSFLIFIF